MNNKVVTTMNVKNNLINVTIINNIEYISYEKLFFINNE